MTDKVYRENPGWPRSTLRIVLCELLGVERCLVIPAEPGDCFGHADGVVRFLDRHTVVVNDYSAVEPEYGRRLQATLRRAGLRVEPMPYVPDAGETDGIPSATGNYVNYLRAGGLVLIPAYGTAEDALARQRLQALLPEARVVPVKWCTLARRGGVLHCVSWNVRLPATAQVGWDSANPQPTGGAAAQRNKATKHSAPRGTMFPRIRVWK